MYVTKGNSFLSDFSLKEIETKYLQESNAKAKIRLQCAVLRKKGKSIPFIADVVGKRESTVSDILRRFEKRSITGCYAIKQKGQPLKLTIAERLKLKKALSKSPQDNGLPFVIWTTKLAKYFIKHTFKKELVGRQVHRIISSFNMSIQKPRPEHVKANKKLRRRIKKLVQAGYAIAFLDESIFALVPYITRGWFIVGSKPTKKILNNPHQKFCVFGAMFKDKIVTKITNKINSKKFLAFIKRLHKNNTKICIIVDNASWHLTKSIFKFVKENRVKLVRLLAYSPELNPIEQYWQNVKKWLGTRIWFSIKELKKQLLAGFRKKELMLKSYGY